MKKLLVSSFLVAYVGIIGLLAPMSSCTKDEDKGTNDTTIVKDTVYLCNSSVMGLWEGAFLTNQTAHPPTYFAFTFFSDSTISRRTKNPTGDLFSRGRFSVNSNNKITFKDTTLNFTSTVIQTGTFDYDPVTKTLKNGTWQYTYNSAGWMISGTFTTMNKIN